MQSLDSQKKMLRNVRLARSYKQLTGTEISKSLSSTAHGTDDEGVEVPEGVLTAKRIYKDADLPSFIKVWEPFMEPLLDKISELESHPSS